MQCSSLSTTSTDTRARASLVFHTCLSLPCCTCPHYAAHATRGKMPRETEHMNTRQSLTCHRLLHAALHADHVLYTGLLQAVVLRLIVAVPAGVDTLAAWSHQLTPATQLESGSPNKSRLA